MAAVIRSQLHIRAWFETGQTSEESFREFAEKLAAVYTLTAQRFPVLEDMEVSWKADMTESLIVLTFVEPTLDYAEREGPGLDSAREKIRSILDHIVTQNETLRILVL